jgi:hypothetical protein
MEAREGGVPFFDNAGGRVGEEVPKVLLIEFEVHLA